MRHIVFVGGGPFARQLLDWVTEAGVPPDTVVRGYLATGGLDETAHLDLPVLGDAKFYQPQPNDRFLCALLDPIDKLNYCQFIKTRGGQFDTFMSHDSGSARRIKIGEGCILSPKTELTADVVLGDFVTVHSYTGLGHDARVGDGSTIGSHCDMTGYVKIGKAVLIQPQVVVLPGVQLGDGSRIGAGSVVVSSVSPGASVWGVPARATNTFIEAYF